VAQTCSIGLAIFRIGILGAGVADAIRLFAAHYLVRLERSQAEPLSISPEQLAVAYTNIICDDGLIDKAATKID
jgi:hypothetical protein